MTNPRTATNFADFTESSFELRLSGRAEIRVMASCIAEAREQAAGIALNREHYGAVEYVGRLFPCERPYWIGSVRRSAYRIILQSNAAAERDRAAFRAELESRRNAR